MQLTQTHDLGELEWPNRVLSVKVFPLAKLMTLEVWFPEKVGLIEMDIQRLITYQ